MNNKKYIVNHGKQWSFRFIDAESETQYSYLTSGETVVITARGEIDAYGSLGRFPTIERYEAVDRAIKNGVLTEIV